MFFATILLLKVYIWSLHWEVRECIALLAFWVWLVAAMCATPLIIYLRTRWKNPILFIFLSYVGVFIAFVLVRYLLGYSVWYVISLGYLSCAWPSATKAVDFYLLLSSGSALFGVALLAYVSFYLIISRLKNDRSSFVFLVAPSLILLLSIYSLWLVFYWQ